MSQRDLIFTILGIDKGSQAFDKVGNSADKAGQKLDKFGSLAIKSMLGVQAAGIASGVAIAGALGGVPLLFGGIAAAAVSSNKDVQDSFKNLAGEVKDDVKGLAEPLAGDFVDIANDLSVAWEQRFAPALRMAFTDPRTMGGVKTLTKGVTELASNALPGLLALLTESEPAVEGLRSAMSDTGKGFTEFARNISESSDSAGQIVAGFGRITSDVLGDVGSLLAKLSDSVAPHMGQIEQALDSTTNSVLGLASNALPVLSSASGATLGVLNSVLGVLEPISGTLGTGLGLTLAAAGGWRVLTGAGNAFTKLDLGGKVERTALSAGVLTESLTGSAVAGERVASAGSRMATVLRGVGQALPFVGVAAVGLALAIESSNRAMEQAAEHGRALGEALIKGGSEADRARLQISNLNGENAQLQRQLDGMRASWDGNAESAQTFAAEAEGLQSKISTNNATLEAARKNYEDIRSKLTGAELAQVRYNEAVESYGAKSPEAIAAGGALRAAIDKEAEAQRNAADAVKTHTDRLIEQQAIKLGAIGADLNYRNAILGVDQAHKAMTETLKTHSASTLEGRAAILAYEGALHQAVAAAGEKARAENAARSEADQLRLASQAEAQEILNLAAAAGSTAPAALRQMVGSLNGAALAAAGVTIKVNAAGDAIATMPDGKTVTIKGENAQALRAIAEVNAAEVRNKTFYINQITRLETRQSQGLGGVARGGPVEPGKEYKVNEEGRETFVPTTPGVVIPHSATVALGRAGRLGELGGGKVENHYHLNVTTSRSTDNIVAQFRWLRMMT
ncbi:hypothetical protein C8D88_116147 [Lentzea atacamensis]|uniref:Uncharacterized protein n=1 Tax=Lentzea atacamensis TaxID=531938 RepID=A0A316HLZ3_9PSEU|nr:hypothetical protein [Lentzea atacamensis]PWK81735.1 hypothetical protein C8D88_116147 [Lentzea atacamensis]